MQPPETGAEVRRLWWEPTAPAKLPVLPGIHESTGLPQEAYPGAGYSSSGPFSP